ncbi:unnamed protein product, partial [Mesorhabditis spiculigera]
MQNGVRLPSAEILDQVAEEVRTDRLPELIHRLAMAQSVALTMGKLRFNQDSALKAIMAHFLQNGERRVLLLRLLDQNLVESTEGVVQGIIQEHGLMGKVCAIVTDGDTAVSEDVSLPRVICGVQILCTAVGKLLEPLSGLINKVGNLGLWNDDPENNQNW